MSPSAVSNLANAPIEADSTDTQMAFPSPEQGLVPDPAEVPNPTHFPIAGQWTVDKVLSHITIGRPAENTSSPVPYFHLLERVKTTKREGWRRFGILRGESVADHMYRMALMAKLAPASLRDRINISRCVDLCLAHDMAESLVGDITPVDGVEKLEKSRREATTMDYITRRLLGGVEGGVAGEELRGAWQEYEDLKTLESKFVHDIDKLDLLLQALEYEQRGERRIDLGAFCYVAERIVTPEVQVWAREVQKEREAFWAGKKHVQGEKGVESGGGADHMATTNSNYSRENEKE